MYCKLCNKDKNEEDFYSSYKSVCKTCVKLRVKQNRLEKEEYYKEYDRNRHNHVERIKNNSERARKLKETNPDLFKERQEIIQQKYKSKSPEKYKARNAVNNSIRNGTLLKIDLCENCGDDYRVQAHHESYEEDRWLDIVWLCDKCHKKRHKQINKENREGSERSKLSIPFAPIGLQYRELLMVM